MKKEIKFMIAFATNVLAGIAAGYIIAKVVILFLGL